MPKIATGKRKRKTDADPSPTTTEDEVVLAMGPSEPLSERLMDTIESLITSGVSLEPTTSPGTSPTVSSSISPGIKRSLSARKQGSPQPSPSPSKLPQSPEMLITDTTDDMTATHPLLEKLLVQIVPQDQSKPLLCKECGRRYRNLAGIVQHFCVVHANGASNGSDGDILKLKLSQSHSDGEQQQSGEEIDEMDESTREKPKDRDEKPFTCFDEGCKRSYRNANGLAYHMEINHGLGDIIPKVSHLHAESRAAKASNAKSPKKSLSEKTFRCPYESCGKMYKNKNGLAYHLENAKHPVS